MEGTLVGGNSVGGISVGEQKRSLPAKHGQRMAERAERAGTRWNHPTFACSGTRWDHPEFRLGANGFAEMLRNVQAPAGTRS